LSAENIEARIILDYHSLEKGFLFADFKPGFAKEKVKRLHQNLDAIFRTEMRESSQVVVACQVMCEYYDVHRKMNFDIRDYFADSAFEKYKKFLGERYSDSF